MISNAVSAEAMNFLPPNATAFIGATTREVVAGTVALFGVGYDGTTSFRPGTRRGPDGIRSISEAGIETYSPFFDADLEDVRFSDLGNIEIPHGAPEPVIEEAYLVTKHLLGKEAIPLMLGGEHSITPGPIRAAFEKHPDLAVIQFDAHADLREEWNGSRHSHACAMRRTLDFLKPDRLLQVGIRSGTKDEFQEMRKAQRLVPAESHSLRAALDQLGERPLYITWDVDFFDPSLVPGTGTPEAGGIDWATCETLLETLQDRRIIALDLMELAPGLDNTEVSSCVAAKLLREMIFLVSC